MELNALSKLKIPASKEVYRLKDQDVKMERAEGSAPKGKNRYVLIASSNELLKRTELSHYNIIPLTNSGSPDLITYPIDGKYEYISPDFTPTSTSLAILYLYQPIRKKYFDDLAGILEDTCYHSIIYTLCNEIIGLDDYDLDP